MPGGWALSGGVINKTMQPGMNGARLELFQKRSTLEKEQS